MAKPPKNKLIVSCTLVTVLVPIFIMQVGAAFIFPCAIAKALDIFPEKAGKAAAALGCINFLGATLASVVISVLHENTLLPLATVYAVIILMMLLAYGVIIRVEKKSQEAI